MMIQPITAYPSREGRDRGASLGSSEPGFRVSAPPQALGQSRRRGRASPGTAPRRPRGPEGAGASDSCPGLTLHRLRIPDFCPPAPEQIDRFVQIVDEANARGEYLMCFLRCSPMKRIQVQSSLASWHSQVADAHRPGGPSM
ncbi:dual specificity protein phosphatase 23 isoform X4 [Callithrix jacchus]